MVTQTPFSFTASQPNSNLTVGFVLYDNDVLFQSKSFKSRLGTSRRVISGSTTGVKAEYVTLSFKPLVLQTDIPYITLFIINY